MEDKNEKCQTKEKDLELHTAIEHANVNWIKELLAEDWDLEMKDEKGRTALHLAMYTYNMYFDNEKTLELLIKAMKRKVGVLEKNLVDDQGLSYLHILCTRNDPDLVLKILKSLPAASITSTVNENCKIWPGYAAIHFAVEYERSKIVKILLEHGAMNSSICSANYNAQLQSCLKIACVQPPIRIQDRLFEAMGDEDDHWDDPEDDYFDRVWPCLINALSERKSIVEQLLQLYDTAAAAGNDESDRSSKESVLFYVLENYYVSSRDWFFDRWDIDQPLKLDVKSKLDGAQKNVIVKLLNAGAPITPRIYVLAARLVTQHRDEALLDLLLDHDADPNFVLEDGQTLLQKICKLEPSFSPDCMIKSLLKCGARSDVADCRSTTPLHSLAKIGTHISAMQALLRLSCEDSSNDHCSRLQLDGRFNVDAQDETGNTPLFYALDHNGEQAFTMLKMLLPFGCDLNIENDQGLTALSSLLETDTENFFNSKVHRKMACDISEYLLKLQTAGCFISKKIREQVAELVTKTGYFMKKKLRNIIIENSETEVDRLKEVRIDKFASLHSLLAGNVDRIARYANNEVLKDILEASDFEEDFPIYGQLIISRFVRGVERRILLNKARILKISADGLPLPDVCLDRIFQFLNDNTLRNVIRSAEVDS